MSQHHGAITLSGLVSILESLLSVKECTIHAYFSIEAELVLLVAPSNQNPSAVQVRHEKSSAVKEVVVVERRWIKKLITPRYSLFTVMVMIMMLAKTEN